MTHSPRRHPGENRDPELTKHARAATPIPSYVVCVLTRNAALFVLELSSAAAAVTALLRLIASIRQGTLR